MSRTKRTRVVVAAGILIASSILLVAIGLELRAPAPLAAPILVQTERRTTDGMEMVSVPSGEFEMGSGGLSWLRLTGGGERGDIRLHVLSDQRPGRIVHVDAFWIDRTEVTVAMFRGFVDETGYVTTAEEEGWGKPWRPGTQDEEWPVTEGVNWQHPSGEDEDAFEDHPVAQVSWHDAAAYCAWVRGTLPTEAEWEKAARGTDGRRFPWGNEFDGARLNYCDARCPVVRWRDPVHDDGHARTSPVGSYPTGASPYGAFDMAGNVWEWVADWYEDDYYSQSPDRNPTGPASGTRRAMRGGAWYDGEVEAWTTTTIRHQNPPEDRYEDVGFRCVVRSTGSH